MTPASSGRRLPLHRGPPQAPESDRQEHGEREMNQVREIAPAADMQRVEGEEDESFPPTPGLQEAVPEPQHEREPGHPEDLEMGQLIPSIRREGEEPARDQRRGGRASGAPVDPRRRPTTEDEGSEKERIERRGLARQRSFEAAEEEAGADHMVGEREHVLRGVKEGRVPEILEAVRGPVAHPTHQVQVEERVARVGRDMGGETAREGCQIEEGDRGVEDQRGEVKPELRPWRAPGRTVARATGRPETAAPTIVHRHDSMITSVPQSLRYNPRP